MVQKRIATAVLCASFFGAGSSLAVAQAGQEMRQTQPGQSQQPGMQQQDPRMQTQPGMQQAREVSKSDLALFAEAAKKVAEVQQEVRTEMQQAESAQAAQVIQAEAQDEMISAVQSVGMTVDEYNRISTLTQSDPEIRERLREML